MAAKKRWAAEPAPDHIRKKMQRRRPEVMVEVTTTDILIHLDGAVIAKRGKPGTPQAKTWVSLEPAIGVYDEIYQGESTIVVKRDGVLVH